MDYWLDNQFSIFYRHDNMFKMFWLFLFIDNTYVFEISDFG